MKRQKIDNSIEKLILTGMITSTEYLREVRDIYQSELIEIPYVDIVAEWCLEHYRKYGTAPGADIQSIFYSKSPHLNDELAEQVEKFLSILSRRSEKEKGEFNTKYVLDKTVERFKSQKLKYLAEDILTDVDRGGVPEAENRIKSVRLPSLETDLDEVEPFSDKNAIFEAFRQSETPLIEFPGALGEFWNHEFVPEAFISLCGPEKRGKTWMLMLLAMYACRARRNVAVFQVGDMSQDQMLRRMSIYLTKRSDKPWYCGEVPVPILDCAKNQDGTCNSPDRRGEGMVDWDGGVVEVVNEHDLHVPCTECMGSKDFIPTTWYDIESVDPLSPTMAVRAAKRFRKWMGKARMKLSSHPSDSVSVSDLESVLDRWKEKENFEPEIIIIDYADILAPEPGSREFRHQVNATWKAMRRLSQERKCCVITATQADAASYDQKSVGLSNFSEDKRKRAHVTAEFGLNQTTEEKKRGIMRIGQIVARESEVDHSKEVHITQCLRIGRPFLDSWF